MNSHTGRIWCAATLGIATIGGVIAYSMNAHAMPEGTPSTHKGGKRRAAAPAPKAKKPAGPSPDALTPARKPTPTGRSFELVPDVQYRAIMKLADTQAMASNNAVADRLQAIAGPWRELHVLGKGAKRTATGIYGGYKRTIDLPAAIVSIARTDGIPSHAVKVVAPNAPAAKPPAPHKALPAASSAEAPHPPVEHAEPAPATAEAEHMAEPVGRAPSVAARQLYDYVTKIIRGGQGAQLREPARDDFVNEAQHDMKGAKLLAALNKGQGGLYGPLTRARGKELIGREFPKA